MRRCALFSKIAAISGISLLAACASDMSADMAGSRCDLAIRNVHVVDIEDGTVARSRTVEIGGGRILAVAPSAAARRAAVCARQFDGAGRYLSPGLNDAHIHLETNAFTAAFGMPAIEFDYEAALALYLAHGVTGVRVMSGAPDILAFRDSAETKASPMMSVSSPMLSGAPPILPEPLTRVVEDEASARAAVGEYLDAGYDFIKIRSNLKKEVYAAVLAAANERGAQVDGHVTRAVGAMAAIGSGQDGFAHLDEIAIAANTPEENKAALAAAAACDCFFSSALSVTKSAVGQIEDYDGLLARGQMQYLHPVIVGAFWLKPNNPYLAQGAPAAFFSGLHERAKLLAGAFADADIALVAGTDAMNPMIIPGVSLHEELGMLVEAGLSPQQALKTATVNIADHVAGFEDVGRIAEGKVANAILIDGNPLENLDVLARPSAVIVNGRLLVEKDIDALLERARAQGSLQ